MADVLTIQLNGVERTFNEQEHATTLVALVQQLQFRADRVALELNGEIVSRAKWAETTVVNGDRVELVHFVGGGSGTLQLV